MGNGIILMESFMSKNEIAKFIQNLRFHSQN